MLGVARCLLRQFDSSTNIPSSASLLVPRYSAQDPEEIAVWHTKQAGQSWLSAHLDNLPWLVRKAAPSLLNYHINPDMPSEEVGDVTVDKLEAMMVAGRSKKSSGRSKGSHATKAATGAVVEPNMDAPPRKLRDDTQVHHWGSGEQEEEAHQESPMDHSMYGDALESSSGSAPSTPRGVDDEDLFFVDTAGDASASITLGHVSVEEGAEEAGGSVGPEPEPEPVKGLLLPEHVQLGGISQQARENAEQQAELVGVEGDYLELDAKNEGAAARYYQAQRDAEIEKAKECGACGETGHMRKECPHEQCLACGALDEHRTRDCPLRISCFRCGAHGHISRDCPEARTTHHRRECTRCGAPNHSTATCPTLWRIYVYRDEGEYRAARRKKSRDMRRELGALGGELDSASGSDEHEDEADPREDWDPAERWCYNCASRGEHWGDDCPYDRIAYRRSAWTASIFSEARASDGPFASALAAIQPAHHAQGTHTRGHPHVYGMAVGPASSIHVYGPGTTASRGGSVRSDRDRERERQAFDRANPTRPSEAYRKQARKVARSSGQEAAWDVDTRDEVLLNGARGTNSSSKRRADEERRVGEDEDAEEGAPPKKRTRTRKSITRPRGSRGSGKGHTRVGQTSDDESMQPPPPPPQQATSRGSGTGSFNHAARRARRDSLDEQRDYHVAAAREAAGVALSGGGGGGSAASSKRKRTQNAHMDESEISGPPSSSRKAQSERDRAANEEQRRRREQSEKDRERKRKSSGGSQFGPFSKDDDHDGVPEMGDFEFDFESDFRGGSFGGGAGGGGGGGGRNGAGKRKGRDRGWDREPDRREGRRDWREEAAKPFRRPAPSSGGSGKRSGAGPMYKGGYR